MTLINPIGLPPPEHFMSEGVGGLSEVERAALKVALLSDQMLWTAYWVRHRHGVRYNLSYHHVRLAAQLERIATGEVQNLLINIAPGAGKTEISTIGFISRQLTLNPLARFMHLTSSPNLALENSTSIRDIFQSEDHRLLYDLDLMTDSTAKDRWHINHNGKRAGGLLAFGLGQNPLGFRAGRLDSDNPEKFNGAIVIDDPQKPEEMLSKPYREKAKSALSRAVLSRKATSETPIVIIMQRLHLDDVSNYVLEERLGGLKFEHVTFPAILDEGTRKERSYWPAKQPLSDLQKQKKADSYMFAAQYQQKPTALGGSMLKTAWWTRFKAGDPQYIPEIEHIVHSWDLAASDQDLKTNSYNACTVWAVEKTFMEGQVPRLFLIDAWRGREDYGFIKGKALDLFRQYQNPHRTDFLLIEDKANGKPLIQELRNTGMPVRGVNPTRDKITRAYVCQPWMQTGQIHAPQTRWADAVIEECAMFPNGEDDDYVDTVTQALTFVRRTLHSLGSAHEQQQEPTERNPISNPYGG